MGLLFLPSQSSTTKWRCISSARAPRASPSSRWRFPCTGLTERKRTFPSFCTYIRYVTSTVDASNMHTSDALSCYCAAKKALPPAWPSALPCRPVLNSNTTVSFLLTTDVDVGDLMIVKLRWEKDSIISWSDWWGSSKVHIRKLRIKSGETQSK